MKTINAHKRITSPRPITLALEGGGALGAFSWGVLDRLIEHPELRVEVVGGTSAGAMNAAMLAQGLKTGGPEEARRLLETFWQRVAISAGSVPGPLGQWMHLVSPVVDAVRHAGAALCAPSPVAINPLRGILAEMIDPEVLQSAGAPELVVAATMVRTGEARLFRGEELSVDALLASACLPQLFPAVEIDGESYWDGGYTCNPPLRHLIETGAPADVLIVRTTPLERTTRPSGSAAVKERVNEITFGSALRGELRTLAVAQPTLTQVAKLPAPLARLRDARLHMIGPETAEFQAMHAGLMHTPDWNFLSGMHKLGSEAAERWLAAHEDDVGVRSSLDIRQFAGNGDPAIPESKAA
jgi:NTE family protein